MTVAQNRKVHIDILRILAAFLVIYNHSAGYHYYLGHTNSPSKIIAAIALSSLTKINVPLFFMISGALLLQKEETYKTLFSKRILRFLAVLTCASLAVYLYYYFTGSGLLSVKHFIFLLFSGNIIPPYWFLYAYLGFLFALPFLRKIAKYLTHQDILFLIVLRILFSSVMHMADYITSFLGWDFISISGNFALPFAVTDIFFYPLIGYYMENKVSIDKIGRKEIAALLGMVIVGTMISTAFTYHEGINLAEFTQNHLSVFTYLSAIAVYLIVKIVCVKIKEKHTSVRFERMLSTIGTLTLGIYLMDPIFSWMLPSGLFSAAEGTLYIIPVSFVYCCASMVVCGSVTYVLKKIPVINKFL